MLWLTCNVGKVEIFQQKAVVSIDIRYPVTSDGDRIMEYIQSKASQYHLSFHLHHLNLPLYMEEHAPFISLLKQAYQTAMGKEANLYATGEVRMHVRFRDAVSHLVLCLKMNQIATCMTPMSILTSNVL